mgnify:CR=1 FL=1
MQKYISIIILLVLFGCNSPRYREVMVNKTVKVFSEDYHEQAENYTFKWNASKHASGIYFIQLETPTFSSSRKMILVK